MSGLYPEHEVIGTCCEGTDAENDAADDQAVVSGEGPGTGR